MTAPGKAYNHPELSDGIRSPDPHEQVCEPARHRRRRLGEACVPIPGIPNKEPSIWPPPTSADTPGRHSGHIWYEVPQGIVAEHELPGIRRSDLRAGQLYASQQHVQQAVVAAWKDASASGSAGVQSAGRSCEASTRARQLPARRRAGGEWTRGSGGSCPEN